MISVNDLRTGLTITEGDVYSVIEFLIKPGKRGFVGLNSKRGLAVRE